MKNHETTLKTMETMIEKRDVTNGGPQPTSMIKKCENPALTGTENQLPGSQLTSFDPKKLRYWRRVPNDLIWTKNVTLLTQVPNWPPLIQKRYVTDAGSQLTSIDPKTLRYWHGAQPTF